MMFLHNILACCILSLLYLSVVTANKATTINTVEVSIVPRRLRVFETSVRLTVSYSVSGQRQGNTTRFIKIKILNDNNNKIGTLNKTVHVSFNSTYLTVPCETFSHPGRYYLQYFVQGITKTFKELRKKIVVRREKIRIDSPKNHTAVSRSVVVWITSKHKSCKPYKDRVDLYWIKAVNDHVLVTSKKVRKVKSEKRTRIQFGCDVIDTEGIFYFKYVTGYRNRTLAISANMSVSWGKYKLEAQSNNIFPCSTTFAIKFSAPYCDKFGGNKVQIKSEDYNNVISSKAAYPGFEAVFFPCTTFKRHIHDYCFYYITKSSLTKTAKVHTKLCLPSFKTEFQLTGRSQWSTWGSCFSLNDCGQGRKYRYRYCSQLGAFQNKDKEAKKLCTGPEMQSTSCTLPACEDKTCKSCGCVFTSSDGIIVSPESLPSLSVKNKSSCHWLIKVNPEKRVKLWFDTLSLAKNSSVHIIAGNNSKSKLLERVTYDKQKISGDIVGTSNIISIWYYFNGKLNETKYGFQLSYSSVDKSPGNWFEPTKSQSSTKPKSNQKKLVKMTFVGIFALIVVVMAGIFFKVFCKIRRHPCEQKKNTASQPTSSSHTSTACVSETTLRSYFETPASGDESVNNNSSPTRVSNNYRPSVCRTTRTGNRGSVHVCPKCCYQSERCCFEYVDCRDNSYQDVGSLGSESTGRKKLYSGSRYRPVVVETVGRGHYSAAESFRTANSLPEVMAERHYERYL